MVGTRSKGPRRKPSSAIPKYAEPVNKSKVTQQWWYSNSEVGAMMAVRTGHGSKQLMHADWVRRNIWVPTYSQCTKLGRAHASLGATAIKPKGSQGRPRVGASREAIRAHVAVNGLSEDWTAGDNDLKALGYGKSNVSTKRRVMAEISGVPGMKEAGKVQTQTAVRWTAGNAPRAAVSFLLWLAHGLFLVGAKYAGRGLVEVKNTLADLISSANGGAPVFALPLTNMFNRDETVLYVLVGASRGNTSHWARLTQTGTTDATKGHHSVKNAPGNDLVNLTGIRVSIAVLIGGGGSHAPTVVTVTGLTPTQLPGGSIVRFYFPEVNCHLALLRAKGDADGTLEVDHWSHVDEYLYVPWIEAQMTEGGFPPGHPARVAFDSMDGCGVTLKAFASEARLRACVCASIRRFKGHRSRTHKEQPADQGEMFKGAKKDEAHRTVTTGNQRRRAQVITTHIGRDPRVNLGSKLAPIADFVATVPDFEGKHLSERNIAEAFILAKYFQSVDKPYTDVDFAMSSSGTPVPSAVVNLVKRPEVFQELYWGFAGKGVVPENLLTKHGIPFDATPDGRAYVRDENKLPLNQRRHCDLTSDHTLAKLVAGYRTASSAAKETHDLEAAKVAALLVANSKCEAEVRASMQKHTLAPAPSPLLSTATLSGATLADFDGKGNATVLKAFVQVRSRITSKLQGLKLPKKGKATAAAAGEKNLIYVAHDMRLKPVLLLQPGPYVQPTAPLPVVLERATIIDTTAELESPDPGTVLTGAGAPAYVALALGAMVGMVPRSEGPDLARATAAHGTMLRRLPDHVTSRVDSAVKSKLTHHVWRWASLNLGRMAAIMECTRFLEEQYECLDLDDCWVAAGTPNNMLSAVTVTENHAGRVIGVYGAWLARKAQHLRAGMSAALDDVPLLKRWKKHLECSALTSPEALKNTFYRRYCSKQAPTPSPAGVRKGWFEELLQVTYFAIDPESATAFTDQSTEGLLLWPDWFIDELVKTYPNLADLQSKQHRAVCYLFELGADLLLDRSINVSTSPGFEGLLAIFGGNDD
jgi:hypothetical protein